MKENAALAALLAVLLGVSYWSWTKTEEEVTEKKVVLVEAAPADVEGIRLVTKTQTVSVSKKDVEGGSYVWFQVENKRRTRGFVGNDKADELLEKFAPLEAIRGLGPVAGDALERTELDHPERRLEIVTKQGERVFDVGGRTYGSRDHYVRPKGKSEAFLVESKLLGDLQYPESRYMQRKLRRADEEDVASIVITVEGEERRFIHQNRLSKKDAYWAREASPDAKDETVENYMLKLDQLSAREYLEDKELEAATKLFEVQWIDEDSAVLDRFVLFKGKDDKDRDRYLAESSATRRPVEVTRSVGEQLDKDLAVLFASP